MKSRSKAAKKDPNVYPPGWNRRRVESVIAYYDTRADEDVLSTVETSRAAAGLVWLEIPQELVPRVQKLISQYRRSA
jgi:hypothetical protein